MTTNPTWYEILGVPHDASGEEIKAAWRASTDKFEPGTGGSQFRLFNQAADVLLDPRSRAEYDARLAAPDTATPDASRPTTSPAGATATESPQEGRWAGRVRTPRPRGTQTASHARPVPGWALALLAVLTVAAVAIAGVLWMQNREFLQTQEAGDQASAAAARALPLVLSYDYRHLQADRAKAVPYLTPRYRKEYVATFNRLIADNGASTGGASQTKAVVTANVVATGVANATPGQARVVVFLDQATRKADAAPKFSLNRLAVTMLKSPSGTWLIDDITSY